MSGTYPVYETMLIRAFAALPILGVWLTYSPGLQALVTPLWPRILLRALILCSAYLAFILAIAAMPIANIIAIYFTMPFFVAGLAGPFFGERVPLYRWIAIIAGFAGVIVMVRPGVAGFRARLPAGPLFSLWLCRRANDGAQSGATGCAACHRQLAECGLFHLCGSCRPYCAGNWIRRAKATRASHSSRGHVCGPRFRIF